MKFFEFFILHTNWNIKLHIWTFSFFTFYLKFFRNECRNNKLSTVLGPKCKMQHKNNWVIWLSKNYYSPHSQKYEYECFFIHFYNLCFRWLCLFWNSTFQFVWSTQICRWVFAESRFFIRIHKCHLERNIEMKYGGARYNDSQIWYLSARVIKTVIDTLLILLSTQLSVSLCYRHTLG